MHASPTVRLRRLRVRIGNNLERLRMARRLGREDVAREVGVTRWTVMRWEAGCTIPAEALPALTKVLRCGVADLYPAGQRPARSAA